LEQPILAALDPTTGKRQANIDLSSVEVYDVTFEAREVSRAAFLAAIAPPLEESQLEGQKQAFDQAAEVHEGGVSDFGGSSQAVDQVEASDAEIAGDASHQASPNV
jgi:hypothetical protein